MKQNLNLCVPFCAMPSEADCDYVKVIFNVECEVSLDCEGIHLWIVPPSYEHLASLENRAPKFYGSSVSDYAYVSDSEFNKVDEIEYEGKMYPYFIAGFSSTPEVTSESEILYPSSSFDIYVDAQIEAGADNMDFDDDARDAWMESTRSTYYRVDMLECV